jgi:hypothetical protein
MKWFANRDGGFGAFPWPGARKGDILLFWCIARPSAGAQDEFQAQFLGRPLLPGRRPEEAPPEDALPHGRQLRFREWLVDPVNPAVAGLPKWDILLFW